MQCKCKELSRPFNPVLALLINHSDNRWGRIMCDIFMQSRISNENKEKERNKEQMLEKLNH